MLKEILEQQPPAGDLSAPHDKISPQDKKLELSPTKHLRGRKELRDAATYIQASSRESSPGAGREVMNCCMNCGVSFFIYEDGQGKSLQFCSKDCEVSSLLNDQHSWQRPTEPHRESPRRKTHAIHEARSDSPLARRDLARCSEAIPMAVAGNDLRDQAGNRKIAYPGHTNFKNHYF